MQIFQNERARSDARLHLAHEEVERLAVIAERERIARDLHDLLGHTLSMITLKSELARKLTKTDPMRAASEMAEVETISRDTLSQVREAVRGYRAKGMAGEIESAKRALKWASVEFDMHADVLDLPPRHETALALALREGVTNIVRHSGATRARAELKRDPDRVTFTLTDDGCGGGVEGSGLAGIRERVERLDGIFERTYNDGTTLTVRLPLNEHDHPSTPEPSGQRRRPSHGAGLDTRPGTMIRVVIAEDQQLVLGALAALLTLEGDFVVVGQAVDGTSALELVEQEAPDILVTDIEMPGLTGLELATKVGKLPIRTRVVIVTTFARPGYLRRAMAAGAAGYLLKDAPAAQLADGLRRVHRGGRAIDPELAVDAWGENDPLTDRERQVLRLAGEGRSSAEIGAALALSDGTVRNYLSEAIGKLGVGNRIEAARLAREKGWL